MVWNYLFCRNLSVDANVLSHQLGWLGSLQSMIRSWLVMFRQNSASRKNLSPAQSGVSQWWENVKRPMKMAINLPHYVQEWHDHSPKTGNFPTKWLPKTWQNEKPTPRAAHRVSTRMLNKAASEYPGRISRHFQPPGMDHAWGSKAICSLRTGRSSDQSVFSRRHIPVLSIRVKRVWTCLLWKWKTDHHRCDGIRPFSGRVSQQESRVLCKVWVKIEPLQCWGSNSQFHSLIFAGVPPPHANGSWIMAPLYQQEKRDRHTSLIKTNSGRSNAVNEATCPKACNCQKELWSTPFMRHEMLTFWCN